MKHYRITIMDGYVFGVSAINADEALEKAKIKAADTVTEWPMSPKEKRDALEIRSFELIST